MLPEQRRTRGIRIGAVTMGGGAPVRVQTMWKEPFGEPFGEPIGTSAGAGQDYQSVVESIARLQRMGCELIRFAVPDADAAEHLAAVAPSISIPIVADIHFRHELALRCLDFVDKLRINPGNIGSEQKKRAILEKAADRGVPIRIGINGGSLPADLRNREDLAEAMVEAAERELELFEHMAFEAVVVSLKASDIESTVRANELFRDRYDYPLHIGLTEAGPSIQGLVKSSVALSRLLSAGIGETIRVSLSAPCEDEIVAAREILRVNGAAIRGPTIVSCPKCARAGFDVHAFLAENRHWLDELDCDVTIAVMGCEVNGPGEAKHADVGIAGSRGKAIVFRRGEIVARVTESEGGAALRREIESICR